MTIAARLARAFERTGERPFRPSGIRTLAFALRHRASNVLVGLRFRIVNSHNIHVQSNARLRFGTNFYGFLDGNERSLIRVRGSLVFEGDVSIGGGARWDIGPHASATVGHSTYFSPQTLIVATRAITIGDNCAVGWGVQILDADFHAHGDETLKELPPAKDFSREVKIGNHVWIGSGVKLYKGVVIPDGCIVAGGAVVTRSVTEERALVAGNPARVVKTGMVWK